MLQNSITTWYSNYRKHGAKGPNEKARGPKNDEFRLISITGKGGSGYDYRKPA